MAAGVKGVHWPCAGDAGKVGRVWVVVTDRASAERSRRVVARAGLAVASMLLVGWTVEVRLTEPVHPLPAGAPGVIVSGAEQVDDPVPLVIFLHGWNGCARALVHEGSARCSPGARPRQGWGLGAAHAAAGTGSVLVVPQLAWLARDGSPGRLRRTDYARKLLGQVRGALAEELGRRPELGAVTLVAHSAGYETALALLDVPTVRHVVLLDALYAGDDRFASWLAEDPRRRLASVHIGRGKPAVRTRHLAQRVRRTLGADAVATTEARPNWERHLARHRLTVARSHHGHGALPQRHLAQVVKGLHGGGG